MPNYSISVNSVSKNNFSLSTINIPVLDGGPSTCVFSTYNVELQINDLVEIKVDSTTRFEGYIRRETKSRRVGEQLKREYEAVCKSYKEHSQIFIDVTDQETLEEFQGNGVEYQEWLLRNKTTNHVIWLPTGDDPEIFDDQVNGQSLPSNIIEITEVKQNELPSHVVVNLRKWKEKRFPCLADFVFDPAMNPKKIEDNPNYGRIFKVMQTEDPTLDFSESKVQSANFGGSKFYIEKGQRADGFEKPQDQRFSLSCEINPVEKDIVLEKIGSGSGSGSGSGEGGSGSGTGSSTLYANFVKVDMPFDNGYLLPRVFGAHGTGSGKQETYVRGRYLVSDKPIFVNLGGFNGIDIVTSFEHVELEVNLDYSKVVDEVLKFVDGTFGGAKGALDAVNDLGNGEWLADLSGSYYIENTETKAQEALNDAVSHYQKLTFTADITLAGLNFDNNFTIDLNGTDIVLSSISISFSLDPTQNQTRYSGTKIKNGRSQQIEKKKLIRQKQEKKNEKSKKAKKGKNQSKEPHSDIMGNKEKTHARIAWFFDETHGDISIGEILKLLPDGTVLATEQKVWIDFEESKGVRFDTAGNLSIFEIERIKIDVEKQNPANVAENIILDVYKAVISVRDNGKIITHARLKQKTPEIIAIFASEIPSITVPDDFNENGESLSNSSMIFTLIGTDVIRNKSKIRIPDIWDLTTENYNFLEKSGEGGFLPLSFRPIRPTYDVDKKFFSAQNFGSTGGIGTVDTTIATYEKKS